MIAELRMWLATIFVSWALAVAPHNDDGLRLAVYLGEWARADIRANGVTERR